MDRDVQETGGRVETPEAAVGREAQTPAAMEPEAPVMLTDAACGLACPIRTRTPPG